MVKEKKLYSKYTETNLNYQTNKAKVLIENLQSILVDTFRTMKKHKFV